MSETSTPRTPPPPQEKDGSTGDGAELSPPAAPHRPRRVALAALLTGAQGLVIAALGVVMLVLAVVGEPDGVTQAVTGAVTVLLLAVLPLAAGHGLWRLRRWSRGPAVVVQILALPAGWHMVQVGGSWQAAAVPLMASAVIVLGALAGSVAAVALGVLPPGSGTQPAVSEGAPSSSDEEPVPGERPRPDEGSRPEEGSPSAHAEPEAASSERPRGAAGGKPRSAPRAQA